MENWIDPIKATVPEDVFAGGGQMGALMRALDWSSTALGPVENWPQSWRTALSICLASRFPMILWLGADLIVLYNDAYIPILGTLRHPKSVGKPGREVWPEIWPIIGPMLEGVFATGEATWSDDLLLEMERSGYVEETYFTFSYSAIRDDSGKVCGVFTAVNETTSRVLRERRQRTLRELAAGAAEAKTAGDACSIALKTLAGNPTDIPFALLYLLDAEGRTAHLAGTTGLTPTAPPPPQTINLSTEQEFPKSWPLLAQTQTNAAEPACHDGQSLAGSTHNHSPAIDNSAVVVPVAQPGQNQPAGLLVAGVSPRRALDEDYRNFFELAAGHIATAIANARAYEEERKRSEALAEIDRAKTAFFSNVSHEFRTPLTLLLGPVEDILADPEDSLSPRYREQLETVHRNSLRLLKLVNTLLDFSRLEAGRVQAVYQPTDLATFTAELASVFRSAIERASLRFIVNCPPLGEPVFVDREMWEKIVFNLLSNAFKFTFEGEIEVSLKIESEPLKINNQESSQPSFSILQVRDTGTGIPPEELPHLFQRFHRVRGASSRTHEGTGIGLALVQELVQLHGGTVEVSSQVGVGTTFTVSIPTGIRHLPADRIGGTRTLASTALGATAYIEEAQRWLPAPVETPQNPNPSPFPPSGKRILLADDSADMRDYVKGLLEQYYEVEAVADGAAALAAAREGSFDLILSDVMMPHLDGIGLLRELRAGTDTQQVPVILLSARSGEESSIEGLEAGADDYLIKPFSARELLARVRTHLQMAKLRQEATRREQQLRITAEAAQQQTINILESITDGFISLDREWRYTYVNQAAARMVGKTREELLGKNIWEVFPQAVGEIFYHECHRSFAQQAPATFEEFCFLNTWFENRTYPSPEGLSIYFRDITKRKRTEEELHQREQEFKALAENAPDVIARLDKNLRYLYMNQAVEQVTGMPPAFFIGKTLWELGLPAELLAKWEQTFRQALATGQQCVIENSFATPSGIKYYQSRIVPEFAKDGSTQSLLNITRDITELKQAETALRETNQMLQTLIQASPIAVIALDDHANIKMWSPAAEKIFGWTEQEVLNHLVPFVPPEKQEEFRALHKQNLQGQLVPGVEVCRQKKSGEKIDIAVWGAPLPDAEGNVSNAMALIADISERKRAEEALRKERDFTAAVLDTIGSLVVVLDRQGRIVSFNRACEQATGYTFNEVKGAYVWDKFIPPEQVEPVKRVFQNLQANELHNQYDNDWLTKDKRRRLIAWSNTILHDGAGEVEYIIGTGIDITERRQAEEALRQSEARFRRLAESNLMGIFFADFSGHITDANDAFLQMLGYTKEDLHSGALRWDVMTPPEYRRLDEQKIGEVKVSGNGTPWEKEYIRKDGTRVPVLVGTALLEESQENCVCFIVDLTERKRMEEALRFALQKLNFHVENTPLAVIEWDREFRVRRWSTSAERLFGWQPDEVIFKQPTEWSLIFDEDVEAVTTILSRLVNGIEVRNISYNRNYTKNGSVVVCEWYNSAQLDESGKLVSVLSLVLDVTERSSALAAVAQAKERFRIAAECASDLIYEWEINSRRVEWFGNIDEYLGYAPGEFPRTLQGWENVIHPDDRRRVMAAVEQHLKTGEPFLQEYRVQRQDGTLLYWVDRATILWDERGNPYKWIGVNTDITERHLAQEKILKLNQALERRVKELQTLLEVIPIGIGIAEDAECKTIRVNPAFAKQLKISPQINASLSAPAEEKPSSFKVYQNAKELSPEELPMQQAAANGVEILDAELDVVHEDGTIVKLLEYAAPLFDEAGNTRGCVAAFLDITERKQTEEALRLSEERYRSLAEALPQLVCLSTPDAAIEYCNQSWFDYTGLTLEETKQYGARQIVHPDDLRSFLMQWATSLKTGIGFSIEFRLRRADGVYRWHQGRTVPIKYQEDRILAWLGTATDTEDQKRAEEQERFLADASAVLAHSLEYQTTLDSVARLAVPRIADWCAIDMVESDGSIQSLAVAHVEPAKVELARQLQQRYPIDAKAHWGMPNVIRTGCSELYSEIPDQLLVTSAHDAEHLRILRELGLCSAMVVPLIARGRTLGAITFVLEGSDRRRYEASDLTLAEELAHRAAFAIHNARLYREAQEANRLKDEFLTTLSHELRTPLNSILGWTQFLLSRKFDEEKTRRALQTIERNARAQFQLIKDLLDVSRIITGKLRLNVRPIELMPIIEAAIDSVHPAADAKAIRIQSVLDPKAGLVSGDSDRLQQIVWNLLSNAIKFTPRGRVTITLERINSHVEIRVSDTGIGIKAEFLPFVFDRFRQADGSTTRESSGLGLGLAIVRHLAELHGGSVHASSPGEGLGSTFTVKLPLRAACSITGDPERVHPTVDSGVAFDLAPSLEGLRVLVVDDEADARDFLLTALEECGALVKTAGSVREAMAQIKQFNPNVLVSDIGMPQEDGYALIRQVRALDAERGEFLPAAALTAYAREEDRRRTLLAGFQIHMPKPVSPAELAAVVANLAGRTGQA
ncbi:PAS domain S-box protein [Microcoleus sp. FACHB-672]|uniref:PAS domain S-box protein n=1 Tax=Microcoleus sp. FACHB-672 TaxID=2692825 RepID=UPI0016884766|nr:PAS domain S-box protein [Microcoleus sp. FACHB-672]MBD2040472.1 PAS domain S-box protein [Microcoleus sp. FACHB-672]